MHDEHFENLSPEDQSIVDYHMLRKAVRSNQLIENDAYAASDVAGTERMNAIRHQLINDLRSDGAAAEYMRTSYAAANPSTIIEDIECPWKR